jgi:hypothetical protein
MLVVAGDADPYPTVEKVVQLNENAFANGLPPAL